MCVCVWLASVSVPEEHLTACGCTQRGLNWESEEIERSVSRVCKGCCGLLPVHHVVRRVDQVSAQTSGLVGADFTCSLCKSSKGIRSVNLPYIYRYLANELAGMGIKLKLQFMAFGAAVVLVVWFLCRSPTRSRESDYEVDETGRRRKIMHGDL